MCFVIPSSKSKVYINLNSSILHFFTNLEQKFVIKFSFIFFLCRIFLLVLKIRLIKFV